MREKKEMKKVRGRVALWKHGGLLGLTGAPATTNGPLSSSISESLASPCLCEVPSAPLTPCNIFISE